LADAQANAGPISTVPEFGNAFSTGNFIGSIITKYNTAVFESILSPFVQVLGTTTPTTHNNLSGLNLGDYLHLTAAEYAALLAGIVQGDITQEINAQTGTTYTLVDADHGKLVTLSNASAITLTVPTGLRADFECAVMQLGAGAATFTASGTTINNRQSFTVTAGQYALAGIRQYTTSTFVTTGDMA